MTASRIRCRTRSDNSIMASTVTATSTANDWSGKPSVPPHWPTTRAKRPTTTR